MSDLSVFLWLRETDIPKLKRKFNLCDAGENPRPEGAYVVQRRGIRWYVAVDTLDPLLRDMRGKFITHVTMKGWSCSPFLAPGVHRFGSATLTAGEVLGYPESQHLEATARTWWSIAMALEKAPKK